VNEPTTIRVYPGANGRFAIYDDDGESFDYREGKFTRMLCEWSDANRTLTVRHDPQGQSAKGRRLSLELADRKEAVIAVLNEGTTAVKM
jgi:alpha-glucosidase (family GH31 glycosyl hydrolase)